MGSPKNVGRSDEEKQHQVTLSDYCIDKTEVTVRAYTECVTAKGCAPALHTVDVNGASAYYSKFLNKLCNGDDKPLHPINCVDWYQATAYCRWQSKRLPTEAEWEYAARGQDMRAFPWKEGMPYADRLNARLTHSTCPQISEENFRKHTNFKLDDDCTTTTPVGRFPNGASPFGALDMAGNVWEWTADRYADKYSEAAVQDPTGPATGDWRVLRGGGWNAVSSEQVRTAIRLGDRPSLRNTDNGFRCVWPPRYVSGPGK
jgi:formylglycine-generating enzyme required for sulfatase activity